MTDSVYTDTDSMDRLNGSGVSADTADPGWTEAAGQADLTVEEAFEELERLIKRMEADDISLEESLACYEQGIRLVRFCHEKIDFVEKKVQILRGEGGITAQEEGEDLGQGNEF